MLENDEAHFFRYAENPVCKNDRVYLRKMGTYLVITFLDSSAKRVNLLNVLLAV